MSLPPPAYDSGWMETPNDTFSYILKHDMAPRSEVSIISFVVSSDKKTVRTPQSEYQIEVTDDDVKLHFERVRSMDGGYPKHIGGKYFRIRLWCGINAQ